MRVPRGVGESFLMTVLGQLGGQPVSLDREGGCPPQRGIVHFRVPDSNRYPDARKGLLG